jgi:hypothetical protein
MRPIYFCLQWSAIQNIIQIRNIEFNLGNLENLNKIVVQITYNLNKIMAQTSMANEHFGISFF